MMHRVWLACLGAMVLTTATAVAAPFAISSSSFLDGTMIDMAAGAGRNDADGKPCGGSDLSPQLSWTGVPPGTKSLAILMWDPDGQKGLGVSHDVFYNIPANVSALERGEGTPKNPRYTLGKAQGWMGYGGPCPRIGDPPHHYVITLYALDLSPTLPPGLDRAGLFGAMTGHLLGATSTVFLYQRP